MIHGVTWFCAEQFGGVFPRGRSWRRTAPSASDAAGVLALVGRPVKYFGRLTTESRSGLCAAAVLLRELEWAPSEESEIGLIASSADACLRDNELYFRDYVQSGRTLGRGNLFIYTLPTSVAGEIAIALSLTGPTLYFHDDAPGPAGSIRHAQRMVADGEATRMLVLWSDSASSICLAVDATPGTDEFLAMFADAHVTASDVARQFRDRTPQE